MKRAAYTASWLAGGAAAVVLALSGWWLLRPAEPPWSDSEVETLRSLWIGSLPPPPPDPSNAVADDPRAARLGQRLFFDPRLSGDGKVSCATCHQPGRGFTDGLVKARGMGVSKRNARSIVGSVYSPWLYWDGRRDSLWSQALAPLEDPAEHGSNRMQLARLVTTDPLYRQDYQALFGTPPDFSDARRYPPAAAPVDGELKGAWLAMRPADRTRVDTVFANLGKAIAAFERTLVPGASRFDAYVEAVLQGDAPAQRAIFRDHEISGLRLFLGDAQCTQCHNGPLLTNDEFHNTGVLSSPGEVPDTGRIAGLREALADPFNCAGAYSDDPQRRCDELHFAKGGQELLGAVRTPSLRNLAGTEPFMHNGRLATLSDVLDHYNEAPEAMIGHNEAKPLGLSRRELRHLEAFLATLTASPGSAGG